MAVLSSLLGGIEGHVGLSQQVLGPAGRVIGHGDTDADVRGDILAGEAERNSHGVDDPLSDAHRSRPSGQVPEDQPS